MDDQLYNALIGAAPDENQQRIIAEQLRRRRSFGELGALTGDRVLQPFGQGLMRQADDYADALQDLRQKDTDNAQTKAYQDGQLGHMGNVLAESIRAQDMDDSTTRRGQDLDYLAALARAANMGKGSKSNPRLRQGDIKELQDISQTLGTLDGIEQFISEGGNFGAIEVGGVPVPGGRALANTAAAMGIGTENSKAAFLAKQSFDRLYTLAARNSMFGATLTANEQRAWNDANPSTRQTDAQIMKAIPILRKALHHRATTKAHGLELEGYNPEAIDSYMTVPNVHIPRPGEDAGDSDGEEEVYGYDEEDEPALEEEEGALTPEEEAELAALRKQLGK